MIKPVGEPRILKRAGEVDKQGRIYSPRALAGAAKGASIGQRPERHGMVTGLRYQGGELIANVYFPQGIDPTDIGIELQGDIIKSKIVYDDKGTEYQLVEEFKVHSISLVDRAEAARKENKSEREIESDGGPLCPPHKKMAEKKLGVEEVKEEQGVGGVAGGVGAEGEQGGEAEAGGRALSPEEVLARAGRSGGEIEEAQSAGGGG